jgi:hypothetical protein
MNRIYACAAVVAALSAISVPASALMLGLAWSGNATQMSITEPLPAAQALSPEGKPVRVISLSPSQSPVEVVATSWQGDPSALDGPGPTAQPSAKPGPATAMQTKPAIRPGDHGAAAARKRAAASPHNTHTRSASAKNTFMVSGLY